MLPDVGKERKKERKEERRPVGGKKWGCRRYFLNPGKSVHAEAERRVQRSSRKARINGSVFNHRDIQLTTFAPGGESSFQQKHKANRMRRLQSCSPCASNLERLKAYCTIVKFCANRWRKNRRASRSRVQWKLHVLHVFAKRFAMDRFDEFPSWSSPARWICGKTRIFVYFM